MHALEAEVGRSHGGKRTLDVVSISGLLTVPVGEGGGRNLHRRRDEWTGCAHPHFTGSRDFHGTFPSFVTTYDGIATA